MEPALIAIIGAVVGIVLTNGLKLVLDARARRERVRDIQTALRAEIRSQRKALELFQATEQSEAALAAIGRGEYVPFAPRKADPFLFNAVVGQVHVLPGAVIDPVVLYYGQYASMRAFIDEVRSPQFAALPNERRATLFGDYLGVGREALALADDAIGAINASLNRQSRGQ